jgi:hypothetical protein
VPGLRERLPIRRTQVPEAIVNGERKGHVASFLAAAGAIGLAGVLTRACPGACTSCATCATTLVPMGASAVAVGAALAGSAAVRTQRRSAGPNSTQTAARDNDRKA